MDGVDFDMYIFKINLLVDGDEEDIYIQNLIEDGVLAAITELPNNIVNHVSYVSSQFKNLDYNCSNYGKCIVCGTWASDSTNEGYIEELSNGAVVNDQWYCDLCLPEDHPNHF